jgi:SAM-dependent methyltransferase
VSEVVLACPLCGGIRSVLFDQRKFHGQEVTNRLCMDCGLVFQSPRMTEEEAQAFYAREYRLFQEGNGEPTSRNLAAQRGRAESLLAFSRTVLGEVRYHLDIGCSTGLLLQCFQDFYHCCSAGIEPGEVHRTQARQAGMAVFPSLEELEQSGTERFDLISLAHVLEHLPDPVNYLVHLREHLLLPGGWLLLEVPNLFAHDSFEVAHLISFSLSSLTQVLRKAGFLVKKAELHGRPRSKLLRLYISLLAQPADQASGYYRLHAEKLVKTRRRLGMLYRRILERFFPRQAWQ